MRFPIVYNFDHTKIVGYMEEDKIKLKEHIDLRMHNISMCYEFRKMTNGHIDSSSVVLKCASLVPIATELKPIKKDNFFFRFISYLKYFFKTILKGFSSHA